MRVLVLGGYGLIGSAIVHELFSRGDAVTGLGRNAQRGRSLFPDVDWIEADLSKLTQAENWSAIISGFDAVVNASGVLQDGLKDDVKKIQCDAILALIAACEREGVKHVVQISAPGANVNSDTQFYRTKGQADEALKASSLQWTIFRPGLVISPHAYGGTSLLRALAGFPVIQPCVSSKAMMQTVAVGDVAAAVAHALTNNMSGGDYDLVAPEPHKLIDIVLAVRNWLGFGTPKFVLSLPQVAGAATALLADLASWFGWRSPVRSTAIKVLTSHVTGDATAWPNASGLKLKSLDETLKTLPSNMQERVFSRAMLLFPLLVVMLGGFWLASGIIGLVQAEDAKAVFSTQTPAWFRTGSVYLGGVIDILIGACVLIRPITRPAAIASVLVALAYLVGATVFAPHLWVDPLGAMVKVFPVIALGLCVAGLAEER